MNKNLNKIWQEICELDPELKKYEKELKESLKKLIELTPKTGFSEDFKISLRSLLRAKVDNLMEQKAQQTNKNLKFFFRIMQNLAILSAGFVIGLLPIFQGLIGDQHPDNPDQNDEQLSEQVPELDFSPKIIANNQQNAYGKIAIGETAQIRGLGGDVSTSAVAVEEKALPADRIGIMPIFENKKYEFVYNGELKLPEEKQLAVYRKTKDQNANIKFSNSILSNFNLGLTDLSSFNNLELINLQLAENQEFGYAINLNLPEGQFSINQNHQKWPNPMEKCWQTDNEDYQKTQECINKNRLQLEDMPSDQELIDIAQDFLTTHKINIDSFQEPFVLDDWQQYLKMAPESEKFAPEEVIVIFPLEIDQQTVYDTNNKSGLFVGVNTKYRRVTHIQNLDTQTYEKSPYDSVQDIKELKQLITKGGINPIYSYEEVEEIITVELGEPEIGLMRHWRHQNGISEQLLVPAMYFPIKNMPEDFPHPRKKIVIPLVKDAIEQNMHYYR